MFSLEYIFAEAYAYFDACASMFNNYLVIFMVYTLITYSGETISKYEVKTYWYDRLALPFILGMYLIHSYLLYGGVNIGDFWYGKVDFFNNLGHYTNALNVTWFVFIITFLIYWSIRLLIYGVYLRTKDTPARIIAALPKFNRLDAFVSLVLLFAFLTQGYSTYNRSKQYTMTKEGTTKTGATKEDYKKAKVLLEEATALIDGKNTGKNTGKNKGENNVTK